MNKIRISFKLTESANKRLNEKVVSDGYTMRSKSLWIAEAIQAFLEMPNYPELVHLVFESDKPSVMTNVSVSEDLHKKVREAVLEVRKTYPDTEGVQSNIVRASIMQRLVRTGKAGARPIS
jgi:hypothetical protein